MNTKEKRLSKWLAIFLHYQVRQRKFEVENEKIISRNIEQCTFRLFNIEVIHESCVWRSKICESSMNIADGVKLNPDKIKKLIEAKRRYDHGIKVKFSFNSYWTMLKYRKDTQFQRYLFYLHIILMCWKIITIFASDFLFLTLKSKLFREILCYPLNYNRSISLKIFNWFLLWRIKAAGWRKIDDWITAYERNVICHCPLSWDQEKE